MNKPDHLLNDKMLSDIRAHANETRERECCGLIVMVTSRLKKYIPVRNIATSNEHFVMHPADQAAAEDKGLVLAVVHSHPKISPQPSQADLVSIEKSQLPWVIVNWPVGHYTITAPSGYKAQYLGREFSHGILDCYSLVRDWYKGELGIELKDYPRGDGWWMKGEDLYRKYIDDCGFVKVTDGSLQLHDFLLIQRGSPVPNHGAIYMGDNKNLILHHLMGRLSCQDIYGGDWRKLTIEVRRWPALIKPTEVAA